MHGDRLGAVQVDGASLMPRAAASSASPHDASTSSSPLRTSGAVTRSGAVDRLEGEAALVAQPAVVHRIAVDAEVAGELVGRGLHRDAAADRAHGARRLDLLEVPRPGLEAVGLGEQRAHRADLHGVAAEVRRERLVGERVDLGVVAAVDELDQRVAGDLVGEAGAAVALDAALAVEQHEVRQRDGLLPVALLLDEAGLAGAERERLVLQRALAALVAHRAVERVVDEQELEDAVLRLLDRGRVGDDLLALGHRHVSRRACSMRAARARRPRPGTCGTCRPAASAGGSRSGGCRCRRARRRR